MSGLVSRVVRGPLRLQLSNGYVNQVTLVGNIGNVTGTAPPAPGTGGSDEESHSNKPVRISLAVEKPMSRAAAAAAANAEPGSEARKKPTQWFQVVIFKPHLQRFAVNRLEKGNKIFVSGSLQVTNYVKDNVEKTAVSILADEISIVAAKKAAFRQDAPEAGGDAEGQASKGSSGVKNL